MSREEDTAALARFQPLDIQPGHPMMTPYGPAALQERPGSPTRELPAHMPSRDRASGTELRPNFEPQRGTATDGTDGTEPDPSMTTPQSPPKRTRRRRSSANPSPDASGNAGSAGESATENAAEKVIDAAETSEQEKAPPGEIFTVRAPQLGGMQR